MKILVTGTNGMLGQKLLYKLRNREDVQLIATARGANRTHVKDGYVYEPLDISKKEQIYAIAEKHKPDCIINAAAMTNVDLCEERKEECYFTNADAVFHFSEVAEMYDIHLVQISTDFVFDGTNGPYGEEEQPHPLSYYAGCKEFGEQYTMNSPIDWALIRTIMVYGVVDDNTRSNIVLWTKKSLEQHQPINVITDQFRSPTLAEDLADACVTIALKRLRGVYHVSGKENMSVYDIVQTIADFFNLDKSYIKPVTTAELNQPAKRPLRTGFILDKAIRELNFQPHTFHEGLEIVKNQLAGKTTGTV